MNKNKNLVIEVLEPRMVVLPAGQSDLQAEASGLRLKPGENNVSEMYWNSVKKKSSVKILLAAKVIKKVRVGKARELAVSFDGMTNREFQEKLETLDSPKLLMDLRDNTKDTKYVELANKKINQLMTKVSDE